MTIRGLIAILAFAVLIRGAAAQQGDYQTVELGAVCPIAQATGHVLDDAALETLRAEVESTGGQTLLVLHRGQLAYRWSADDRFEPIEMMSATKSLLALAVAALVTDNTLESFDVKVADFIEEFARANPPGTPGASITVRDLMSHTSGLSPINTGEIYAAQDVLALALSRPVSLPIRRSFSYNNSAVNLLAGTVSRVAGMPADEYIARRLFAPMGITRYAWYRDPAGNPHGMAGCKLDALDAAKLGQLLLNGGSFGDRQLIQPDLIAELTRPGQPLLTRCGLLWWRYESGDRVYTISAEALDTIAEAVSQDDPPDAQSPDLTKAIRAARGLAGQTGSREALEAALAEVPESESLLKADKALSTFLIRAVERPAIAYYADGYLGQIIFVIPDQDLVVVRQQTNRSPPSPFDFERFAQHALRLGP